jgi:tetratricopeptide (TPR) repeat protein
MHATLLAMVLLVGDPNEWNQLPTKKTEPVKAAAGSTFAFPEAARARYQDAVAKVSSGQYGPANDVLNELAGEFPRLPEIFATRCSAQLGLRHPPAAEADCQYALALRPNMPSAIYGLAVAEDSQGKYDKAVEHYRQYSASKDPLATAELKTQAAQRAQLISGQAAAAPAPSAKGTFVQSVPGPGTAIIYVYRNIVFGLNAAASLTLDLRAAGDLPNDTYVELQVKPGQHHLAVIAAAGGAGKAPPTWTVPIEIAQGQVLYLKLEYAPLGEDVGFRPIAADADEARREIREDCALSGVHKL